MDLLEYTEYFENLAELLLPIGHNKDNPRFARVNVEELFSKLRTELKMTAGPVLLLENYDGLIERNDSDQTFDDRRCAFMIVRSIPLNNFEAEQAAVIQAERLGKQIIAKMNEHYRDDIGLSDYSPSSGKWVYNRVSGILTNCHGYRFEFTISEGAALVVDEDLWEKV